MPYRTDTRFKTWPVQNVAALILWDEENHPVPKNASTGMLLARVVEDLGHASDLLGAYQGAFETEYEDDDGEVELDVEQPLVGVAAFYFSAAVCCVDAAARAVIDADRPLSAVKDSLLEELDERVEIWRTEEAETYLEADEDCWPKLTLTMLIDVCRTSYAFEALGSDKDEPEAQEKLDEFIVALMETAEVAAVAGQWFVDLQSEIEED